MSGRLIADIAQNFYGEVTERYDQGGVELLGLPTGFWRVDDMTGGLQPDDMWIVAARAGLGKSACATQITLHNASSDFYSILFSLEMRGEIIVNRLLSSMTGIPAGRIIRGKFSEQEWYAIGNAIHDLEELNIIIYDQTVKSDDVINMAMKQHNVGLVTVDYAGILADESKFGEVERMSTISANIRKLARPDYLNVPVILVAQINRASELNEGARPTLANLKGSGSLEQDASVVLFPFRTQYYEKLKKGTTSLEEEEAEIIVAKNRNGAIGTTPAKFNPMLVRWSQEKKSADIKGRNK